jgi:hypothetical protein
MRIIACVHLERADRTLFGQTHLDLGGIEIKGTAPLAGDAQCLIEPMQVLEMRHQGRILGAERRILRQQDCRDLGVGQPRPRADHSRLEVRPGHGTVRVHAHFAHERQPIDLGSERAQFVRKRLRQHRQHAVGKVDRGRTGLRFDVERAAEGTEGCPRSQRTRRGRRFVQQTASSKSRASRHRCHEREPAGRRAH